MNTKIQLLLIFFIFSELNLLANNTKITSQYLLDANQTYNTKNIYANLDKFKTLTKNSNNFGLSDDTLWIYAKIKNQTDKTLHNIISFPYPLLDKIYVIGYKNAKPYKEYLTGDLSRFDSREIETTSFNIPYTLDPHQTQEFIFKINSQGALNIDMKFLPSNVFYIQNSNKRLILGIYFGAVIIMLVYNFILYLSIKDTVYLDYVMFHFFYLLLQLGLNGLAFEYFWGDFPELNSYFIPIMLILANLFSIKFTISFLGLEKKHPKIHLYTKSLLFISVVLFLMTFSIEYAQSMKFFVFFSLISSSSLFLIGLYILIKTKDVNSKFFVFAWGFLLTGVLLTDLQNIGILPVNIFTFYGSQIGAFFELALLSFALAHRYNLLFSKLVITQSNLSVLNKNLENTILQRTQKLNEELNNKNILLRELHHRVKNNLQIISSLISLQLQRVEDENSSDILKQTNLRILSISMIHEKLYQSESFENIAVEEYIYNLIHELKISFSEVKDIHFDVECAAMQINLDKAVPIGLILNELVTNAIKYAFTKEQKNKKISIKITEHANKITLNIHDNGVGVELEDIQKGFGFKLLKTLTKFQLKADVNYFNQNGFNCLIVFKK